MAKTPTRHPDPAPAARTNTPVRRRASRGTNTPVRRRVLVGGLTGGGGRLPGARRTPSTATTGGVPVSGPPRRPGRQPPPPFLTPGQQLALDNWHRSFAASMQGLEQADANALVSLNQRAQGLGHQAVINADMTDQVAAARGVFQSSIRDSALNDIAGTLAQNENILHTNYQTALTADQTRRTSIVGQNAEQEGYYAGLAVQNAAANDNPPPGAAGVAPPVGPHPRPQPRPNPSPGPRGPGPRPTKVVPERQSVGGRGPGRPPRERGPGGPPRLPRVGGLTGGGGRLPGAPLAKPPSGFGRAAGIRLRTL